MAGSSSCRFAKCNPAINFTRMVLSTAPDRGGHDDTAVDEDHGQRQKPYARAWKIVSGAEASRGPCSIIPIQPNNSVAR